MEGLGSTSPVPTPRAAGGRGSPRQRAGGTLLSWLGAQCPPRLATPAPTRCKVSTRAGRTMVLAALLSTEGLTRFTGSTCVGFAELTEDPHLSLDLRDALALTPSTPPNSASTSDICFF